MSRSLKSWQVSQHHLFYKAHLVLNFKVEPGIQPEFLKVYMHTIALAFAEKAANFILFLSLANVKPQGSD